MIKFVLMIVTKYLKWNIKIMKYLTITNLNVSRGCNGLGNIARNGNDGLDIRNYNINFFLNSYNVLVKFITCDSRVILWKEKKYYLKWLKKY